MKNMKRIIAICLLLALSAVMLASCGGKKSQAVATYGGDKYVYEDDTDFFDFYKLNMYHHTLETGETNISNSEYNTILSDAVKSTIMLRVLEEEIAKRGLSVDMDAVNKKAEEDEAIYDKLYEGGFEKFLSDWGLSEDVFVIYNKYEALKEIAKEYLEIEDVTDAEAQKYYDDNPAKYFKSPHFDVNTLYLQVVKPDDADERKEVYNDAMLYIEMLNSGRSWDDVRETVSLKYNSEHGMIFTEYLSGMQCIAKEYFAYVEDLEAAVKALDDAFFEKNKISFEEMFPDGFDAYAAENKLVKETKAYNEALEIYMNYASERYLAEFRYAITTKWETGKTYSTPIYHASYDSYVVLTFTRIEDMAGEVTFEEAKEEIYGILEAQKKEKAMDNYLSRKMEELKVQIKYN